MDLLDSENTKPIVEGLIKLAASHRTNLRAEEIQEYLDVLSKCQLVDVLNAFEAGRYQRDRFPSIHWLLKNIGIDTGPESIEDEASQSFDELRRLKREDFQNCVLNPVLTEVIHLMGGRGVNAGAFFLWDQKLEWNKKQTFIGNYKHFCQKHGRQTQVVLKMKAIAQAKPEYTMTPHERLQSNRAAFECLRQSRETRRTGRNCWDPDKVRQAQVDSSKDDEIQVKYGNDGISPATVFGGVGQ